MPAQILIRNLSRSQVEKAVAESKAKDRLVLKDYDGTLLLAAKQSFPADEVANAVLQEIADADTVITLAAARN